MYVFPDLLRVKMFSLEAQSCFGGHFLTVWFSSIQDSNHSILNIFIELLPGTRLHIMKDVKTTEFLFSKNLAHPKGSRERHLIVEGGLC